MFLDPRFKTDYVEGVDLETVHDNIIDQEMELLSNPNLSDDAARSRSQTSWSSIQGQEREEPPTKKKQVDILIS